MKACIPQPHQEIATLYFDNAIDGLAYCQALFDAQGFPSDFIFIQVNNGFEKLTGLKDAIGKKATDYLPGIKNSNPEMFEAYGRVVLTGKPERFETYLKTLAKWFLVTLYRIDKNFFMAAFEDITDRKETEKELENARKAASNVLEDLQFEKDKLAEAKAKDEALLESIGDAVFACDMKGQIKIFNKVAEQLTGFSAKEALGKHYLEIFQFVKENENKPDYDWIGEAISSNKTIKMPEHMVLIRKDGQRIAVADSAAPVKDGKGNPLGCVVVFRDFTHEREIEKAKTEFISIASHQLRTPVSGLNWLTEALENDSKELPAKQKRYVNDLSVFSKRLVKLLEDLLDFSKIELGTEVLTGKDKIEVRRHIGEFIIGMKLYADSKKHIINFIDNIGKPLNIKINKKLLDTVLQNLLSNAIDYSPANTAVTVTLDKNEHSIKILVSNQGPAIPKTEQSKIFQRFYRSESAKKIKPEGTGLGLYIFKTIVEGIGGKVGFESEPGKDTVFWFILPLEKTIN